MEKKTKANGSWTFKKELELRNGQTVQNLAAITKVELRKALEYKFGMTDQPLLGVLKTIKLLDSVNLSGLTEEATEEIT